MSRITQESQVPDELILGTELNHRVPHADQRRQRQEVEEILSRLQSQPGLVLADEVGMGKTFVALAVAYSFSVQRRTGPVVIVVPSNLEAKWEQDLCTFCELYLANRRPVSRSASTSREWTDASAVRYAVCAHSIDYIRAIERGGRFGCHLVFLTHNAMKRSLDKWTRLAIIAKTLRRYGRGRGSKMIQVKNAIHRFLAELIKAAGAERAHDLGEELWQRLLSEPTSEWKEIFNSAIHEKKRLAEDPVPKSVDRMLDDMDLRDVAEALREMPIRTSDRVSERIQAVRAALKVAEKQLWQQLLADAKWRSPLLVLDEAHHLKNEDTELSRQFQEPDTEQSLKIGDGAMARTFDRMLFLTATPFQLGHHELLSVLNRFGDVRWNESELGPRTDFAEQMENLQFHLDESQRSAIAFQRSWSHLRETDCGENMDAWWQEILSAPEETLNHHQQAVRDAFLRARESRQAAQERLRRWVIRHNKGVTWSGTHVVRRRCLDGAAINEERAAGGISIPPTQLLPFFLAARAAVSSGHDLLGEALSSSYEAFRFTRKQGRTGYDEECLEEHTGDVDLAHSKWYLHEFDQAIHQRADSPHPKIAATVQRVVDLWEEGEKVLVFAFYLKTCAALRTQISQEMQRRLAGIGFQRLAAAEGDERAPASIDTIVRKIQRRFFDSKRSPGARAVEAALQAIIQSNERLLDAANMSPEQRAELFEVMRRFLRVSSTLIRCFPLRSWETMSAEQAISQTLDHQDRSGVSWREKLVAFIEFLTTRCSSEERRAYLEAASSTQTGEIYVTTREDGEPLRNGSPQVRTETLANVQVATGQTRRDSRAKLMRAFNTPFFPDVLVCSEVMGEGVDLQRHCRHVIHHDLSWNPSTIEQRTGRLDRLGCKAESHHPIMIYRPYLSGAADERQFHVMSDREQWFRVVMGQEEVERLVPEDADRPMPLPKAIVNDFAFRLDVRHIGDSA